MNRSLTLMPFPANSIQLTAASQLNLLSLGEDNDAAATLAQHAESVRVVANTGEYVVDAELMDRLPNLGLIAQFGVGYDSIDVAAAVERGIVVTNCAGSNAEEVGDTCFSILLALVREICQAQDHLRSGKWSTEGAFPLAPSSLQGRSMGIFGMGSVGQAVARRAEAFGMPVAYYARRPRDLPYAFYPTLIDLARNVDTLVIAAPAVPSTFHSVNAQVLQALGAEGIVVNVGRGALVDEAALTAALVAGTIFGAALDVFEDEPHVSQALIDAPNTVLVPHIGSATEPTRRAMAELAVANIASWLEAGSVLTPVPETVHFATPVS